MCIRKDDLGCGGLLPVTGDKLIEQLVQQGLTFKPEVVLDTKVESIIRNQDGTFTLKQVLAKNTFQKQLSSQQEVVY